ncbi:MAG: hypothetical protein K0R12_451 [Gammaproteobacteria bacterium]|nr:hypothetical protein [Gammaproteobacteria bacterium]
MRRILLTLLLLITISYPLSVFAFSWEDIFLTRDGQAERALKKGQPAVAARLFSDKMHQGMAWYRAGDYQAALASWQGLNITDIDYNRGNALAKLANYQAAIEAYNSALAEKPDNQDALFNRELVKKLLQQQKQSSSQNNPAQQNQPSRLSKEPPKEAQSPQPPREKSTSQAAAAHPEGPALPAADQQWLAAIIDDPGGLLRQKFLRDHYRQLSTAAQEAS